MRVLHLAHSDNLGGACKAAYRIHCGLRNEGVDSKVLSLHKTTSDPDVLTPDSWVWKIWARIADRIDQLPLRLSHPESRPLSPAWVGLPVSGLVTDINPDIVQLHWICGGFLRPEEIAKINKPMVWRLPDMWAFSGAEHYLDDESCYVNREMLTEQSKVKFGFDVNRWVWHRKHRSWKGIRSMTIVTPSKWLGKLAKDSILFAERRVEVIPTGHDINRFKPLDRNKVRRELNLPLGKKLILFGAGSTSDSRKGMDLLHEALRRLFRSGHGKDWELVVFGGGSSATLDDLGFQTRSFGRMSNEEELASLYAACDIFVCPSREENLPNTAIEAMACGVPTLAFKVGGLPELIDHGQNGYIASPFDIDSLAEGIIWTLDCPDRWKNLSSEARKKIVNGYSMEVQAQKYISLYQDLLREVPNPV